MSSQLKEQEQKQGTTRQHDADSLFNQHLFKTLAYTGVGFGVGMLSSLFFKHRAGMTMFFAGTGAGYGASNFVQDLNHWKKFKDFNQSQSQNLKREGGGSTQDWESLMPQTQSSTQQKRPQYGGSDDDDSKDSKSSSSSSKREQPGSKKSSEHRSEESRKPKSSDQKESISESVKKSSLDSKDSKSQEPSNPIVKEEAPSKVPSLTSKAPQKPTFEQKDSLSESVKKSSLESQGSKSQKSSDSKESSSKTPSPSQSHHETKKEAPKPSTPSQDSSNSKQSASKPAASKGPTQPSASETYPGARAEGQQLQTFINEESEKGKPGSKNEERYKGAERRPRDIPQETKKSEQDRWGKSIQETNKRAHHFIDESQAGSQFSGTGVTSRSQTNAVIE